MNVVDVGYNGGTEFAIVDLYSLVAGQESLILRSVLEDIELHFGHRRPPKERPGVG
jgi:hypothetical protein